MKKATLVTVIFTAVFYNSYWDYKYAFIAAGMYIDSAEVKAIPEAIANGILAVIFFLMGSIIVSHFRSR